MPLSITSYAVPAGSAVAFGILPAGPYYALASAGSATANGIYVGEGTGVTASTGLYIPGGPPVALNGFAGAAGAQQLYAIAGSGTVTAVLMVSTPR